MTYKNYLAAAAIAVAFAGLGFTPTAFAADNQSASLIPGKTASIENGQGKMGRGMGFARGKMGAEGMGMRGIFGTVSAVSGNAITVNATQRPNATTTAQVFIVDATNAKITKNNAAGTISSIAVGDTVMVEGSVTGTNVVAKMIRDGVVPKPEGGKGLGIPAIEGNGQPVVAGSVTSVTGSSIVITNKSNVSYTIDATNAKFTKGGVTAATISNVAVGDTLVVQGTINGTSVVASTVIDQAAKPAASGTEGKEMPHGFFGGIGQFFSHLFGF